MASGDEPIIGPELDAASIDRRIWIGSFPRTDQRLPAFSMIVLCARELQPDRASWQGKVLRVPLVDDQLEQRDILNAVTAARLVATEVGRGGRALVTCAAGRNRSALVATMAMLIRNPKLTPASAIAHVQKRRAGALTNPHFRDYITRLWSSRG